MKRNWSKKELDEHFTLLPSERHLVLSKKTSANRLGFAVLLKYFQQEAQFPTQKQDVPKAVVQHLADQVDASVEDFFDQYSWGGKERSYTEHRKEIRNLLGFRELTRKDNEQFEEWLKEQVQFTHIDTFERNLYQTTYHQLSATTRSRLDALLESSLMKRSIG